VIDNPYVPNAISPNGDGFNDFLKIPFLNGYPQNLVVIFNRWGKKVYEATDYKNDWDGENLPSGTYFYVVTAPTLNQELKGSITLFKD
jgi:gliding motility-associated-like protein